MLRRNFYMPTITRPYMGMDILKELDRALYGRANRSDLQGPKNEDYLEFQSTWNYETENGLMIHIDIPGVDVNDLKVEFKEKVLTVEAHRNFAVGKGETVTKIFKERYQIGEQLDGEKIEAHYENGVLNLFLPKFKKVEPEAVKIQVSTGSKSNSWQDAEKRTVS